MTAIEIFQAASLTYRVNGGKIRQTLCLDIMKLRTRYPGCTIFINGALCEYGAWPE